MTTNISFEDIKFSRKQLSRILKHIHTLGSINSTFMNLDSREMHQDRLTFIYDNFFLGFIYKTEKLESK